MTRAQVRASVSSLQSKLRNNNLTHDRNFAADQNLNPRRWRVLGSEFTKLPNCQITKWIRPLASASSCPGFAPTSQPPLAFAAGNPQRWRGAVVLASPVPELLCCPGELVFET